MTDPIALAVEALYVEYAPAIYRHIYRQTSDTQRAEDLTQDVFCKLLAALRKGTAVKHNSGFLFRIAHNLIIDFYRARDRAFVGSFDAMTGSVGRQDAESANSVSSLFGALDSDLWAVAPGNLETDTIDRLDRDATLRYVCHSLTEPQAAVIQLRYFDGHRFEEIAEMTGNTSGAVKQLQHRALENMRMWTAR